MNRRILGLLVSFSLVAGCVTNKPPQTQTEPALDCPAVTQRKSTASTLTITPADLKVGEGYSTPVISDAQKFIIPVPAWGKRGEPLIYPARYEKAGKPIVDYNGKPVGDRGLVFFNGKDKSWQAVRGDGNGVIIINEVTQEQAKKLYQKIAEYQPNPNDLTLTQLKQILAFAQKQLGLVDMYNSTRTFVKEKMTPAISDDIAQVDETEIEAYGLKKRDDRDVNQAIYVPGEFVFAGPAASPQEFKNGGVIVEQSGKMRGIQPEIFVRTYTLSDGRAITSVTTALKTQCN